MEEKRHHQRFAFDAEAKLANATDTWPTQIVDLSLRGALLARPERWQGDLGDAHQLTIELPGSEKVAMQVSIAHFSADKIGCCCQRIDMDSFAQLKQIALANLGNEETLNRELAALQR